MHNVEIPDIAQTFYFAEDLSECNTVQYINICKLLHQLSIGEIDRYAFQVQAAKFLVLGKKETIEAATEELKYFNISLIADVLDSFFEKDEEDNDVVKQYFIHNPIEKVLGVKEHFYGPSDEFNNVSFGEYVDALSPFYDYLETGETHYLYVLFATFYREKRFSLFSSDDFKKDKRKPYNADRVDILADKFKDLDFGIIYGFFILFTSFQKYLQTAKLYVQGKEIDLTLLYIDFPTDQKQVVSDLPGIGMKSLLYTIAESGVFGTKKEVESAPLWEILIRMYDIRKRDFDALANAKKQNNA